MLLAMTGWMLLAVTVLMLLGGWMLLAVTAALWLSLVEITEGDVIMGNWSMVDIPKDIIQSFQTSKNLCICLS